MELGKVYYKDLKVLNWIKIVKIEKFLDLTRAQKVGENVSRPFYGSQKSL